MGKSNPYAKNNNAVQSSIERVFPDKNFMPNFDFAFDETTNTDLNLQLTAGVQDNLRYAKYVVQDDSGNEAMGSHVMTNATTKAASITIDCSGLVPRDRWRIIFSAALEDGETKISRQVDLLEGEVSALMASNASQGAWLTPS